MSKPAQPIVTHSGGCHCGAVAFEVDAPAALRVIECNCSICSKSGYLHLIVDASDFRLLRGAEQLLTYGFDSFEAKHRFCRVCGIKSFYIPRSHPDGVSVNLRCLDEETISSIAIEPFDGRNWEQSIARLRAGFSG